jgi:hypothetical protein
MASLLTSLERQAVNSALQDMHDTFSKTIYVYVQERKSVPSNTNFNPLYGRHTDQSESQLNFVLTKYEYKASDYYNSNQEESIVDFGAQTNLKSSEGLVRIKVGKDAIEKIKICSKIEINNVLYLIASDLKLEDQINENFYLVYLKREN